MTDAAEGDFPGAPGATTGRGAAGEAGEESSSHGGTALRRVAIVGVGLMGGSLARAIRARWPAIEIVGVDRTDVIAQARAAGAIDRGIATDVAAPASVAAASAAVDLVVLAAPVLQNIASLQAIAAAAAARHEDADRRIPDAAAAPRVNAATSRGDDRRARPLIVTDLGSTKGAIVDAARSLPPDVVFIGGHPMAGAAQGGFAASRADLFLGRPWILTPDSDAERGPAGFGDADVPATAAASPRTQAVGHAAELSLAALRTVQDFVRGVGAEPVVMTAAEHDRVMAYVSHLPQLVASALMRTIGPQVGPSGLAVSGPGLADTTRLAASPSGVWRDICQTNAVPIAAALDALIADLQQVRARLDTPEALGGWLESWLDDGGRWRSQVPNGSRATPPPTQ